MPRGVPLRQASEQYFTLAQSRAHFLRQANGRWHTGQVLVGRGVFGTTVDSPQSRVAMIVAPVSHRHVSTRTHGVDPSSVAIVTTRLRYARPA